MSYTYVATSLKPTAVQHAIICRFTSEEHRNLIIAKGNRLEVHTVTPDGLIPEIEVPIYGRITALDFYRPKSLMQDVLFILTEKKNFIILGFDSNTKKIVNRAIGSVKDRVGRDLESGHVGIIDPESRMIGMLLAEGMLKIIPIEQNGLKEAFNLRLYELRPIDIKFLSGFAKPTICILYEDNRMSRHLKLYHVDSREKELLQGPWPQKNVDCFAKLIIPVPSPLCGLILIGRSTITYINNNGAQQIIAIDPTFICAYGAIDEDGSRYLLGDQNGILYVLVLIKTGEIVTGIAYDRLGSTSIAEKICYLDNGVVYIGSVFGDSQLIKLQAPTEVNPTHVEILERYNNIGPILDMCVVESERQGQSYLVACSGAYKDGSLRVVRSGIGINEQASIEVPGIKGIWSLRSSLDASFDKYLIQSFIGETRILAISGEELSETEIPGLEAYELSLLCSNIGENLFVQVTPTKVVLIDGTSLLRVSEYISPTGITGATVAYSQLCLAQVGGKVTYLELDSSTRSFTVVSNKQFDYDIACLSLRPLIGTPAAEELSSVAMGSDDISAAAALSDSILPRLKSNLLAIGMWTDNTVRLIAIPTMDEIATVNLGVDTQVRDVQLVSMEATPYLLIGLGDGTLISFSIQFTTGLPVLTSRRKVILGTHPISFTCFSNSGSLCVFAASDRPTVIYVRNKKLLFSVVNIPEVNGMAPFHSELFPDCLAMSSEEGLSLGAVDDIQKIHIQSHYIEESPRRIAHNPKAGLFAVCCQQCTLTQHGEVSSENISFFDDGTFEKIHTAKLSPFEEGISLLSFNCFQENVSTGAGDLALSASLQYIVVGTAIFQADKSEPSGGRILVFSVDEDKRIVNVLEKNVNGAVYTLAQLGDKLIAGINSKVHLYSLNHDASTSTYDLRYECGHHGHIMALYLKAGRDFAVVGDLLRSICLLKYNQEANKLEEISRDFNSNYMRAIEIIDDDHYIGAEDRGNIFILNKASGDAATDDERSRLHPTSEFHIGDYINTFRKGSMNSQPLDQDTDQLLLELATGGTSTGELHSTAVDMSTAAVASSNSISHPCLDRFSSPLLFGTVGGMIGSIFSLTADSFTFFSCLERAIKTVIMGVGGLSHDEFRTFNNDRRASAVRNTIDGDLVEMFLDLSKEDMEQVVARLNEEFLTKSEGTPAPVTSSSTASSSSTMDAENSDSNSQRNLAIWTIEDVTLKVEEMARLH